MLPGQAGSPEDAPSGGRAGNTAAAPQRRHLTDVHDNGQPWAQPTPNSDPAGPSSSPVVEFVSLSTRHILVVGRRLSRADEPLPQSSTGGLVPDADRLPPIPAASLPLRQDHPKVCARLTRTHALCIRLHVTQPCFPASLLGDLY